MTTQQHRGRLTYDELSSAFPRQQYPDMFSNQREALKTIARVGGSVTLELPTGSGKTAVGYTLLKALEQKGQGPLFYIVPNKTLVGQVKRLHPELQEVYGRNEYNCLYYPDQSFQADEIPCSLLADCAHRVNQETGQTHDPGARPCPYLNAKFQAKRSRIVVCTMSFFLFTQLFSREWEEPVGLVIDEAHQISKVARNALSFNITDYHLCQAIRLLSNIAGREAGYLENFLDSMVRIVRSKRTGIPTLLEDSEIRELLTILLRIDRDNLRDRVQGAIESGEIDVEENREVLTRVERVVYDLVRYLRAFEYSLETESRHPLNYTYAYYDQEETRLGRVDNRLVVKAYYVAPVIRRLLSSNMTLAYSATIGDPDVFGYETGIQNPYFSFPSDFPPDNTRLFMPTNTPNLAVKARRRRDVANSIRRVARACRRFKDEGYRCLVVVVSERERSRFIKMAVEEGVDVVTYGDGTTARLASDLFQNGEGDVLVGTVANYGEGIDLPGETASVIFFLRPGYPPMQDPGSQFEEKRFGGRKWSVWNWRVMIEALQVRGRNVRSIEDRGVAFFISQQFRRFVYGSLPAWLEPSYRGDLTFDECMEDALNALKK